MKNQIKPEDLMPLSNKIRTPDGTIIQSNHSHDCVEYIDKNGKTYIIDGGLDAYVRRSRNGDEEDLSCNSDSDHELIREHFTWGSYGKNGIEDLHYITLKDMTTEHINNILGNGYGNKYRFVFSNELEWRKQVDG